MNNYNGPKSRLMDDLMENFREHYDPDLDPSACIDWPLIELYLARACSVLEEKGWKNGEEETRDTKEQG